MGDIQGLGGSAQGLPQQLQRPKVQDNTQLNALVVQMLAELQRQLKSLPSQSSGPRDLGVKTPTESEYMIRLLGTTPSSGLRSRSGVMSLAKALGVHTVSRLTQALSPRQALGHLKQLFAWKPTSFDQSLMGVVKGFFQGINYVAPTEDGALSPELTSHHVMGLKYNPLANSESRLEGNLFRAYCLGQNEAAHPQFLDEARETLQLADQYGVDSQPVRDHLKFLYKHYLSETSPKQLQVSETQRDAASEAYKNLLMAERNLRFEPDKLSKQQQLEEAQTQLMNALAECNLAVHQLLDKTLDTYNAVRSGLKSQLKQGGSTLGKVWKSLRGVQQNWWIKNKDWGHLKQGLRNMKSSFSDVSQLWGAVNPLVMGAYFLSTLLPEDSPEQESSSEVEQLMQRYTRWQQGFEMNSEQQQTQRLGVEDYLEQFKQDEAQIFNVIM